MVKRNAHGSDLYSANVAITPLRILMKFKTIRPNIYAVEAKKATELAKLFLRFQEFYESPKYKGKTFSLSEFKIYYKKFTNSNKFTYYNDWVGFNVPSSVFKPFFSGKFLRISAKERWLLNKVKSYYKANQKFYVLGYAENAKQTAKHELAHAYYYTNQEYRDNVNRTLDQVILSNLKVFLRSLGYSESVLVDECHAYILTEKRYLKGRKLWRSEFDEVKEKLQKLFKKVNKRG